MSSNNNDQQRKKDEASSSASARAPCLTNDDYDEEETTRRIRGGPSGAGIDFAPALSGPSPVSAEAQFRNVLQQKAAQAAPITNPVVPKVTTAPSAAKGAWILKSVPSLPEFHPLERTAVFVPNVTDVSEVSSRISSALRDMSVETKYDDEKAKVKCVTADGVDFRVRMYRGRNSYSHGVIVEVQRRFGTSADFYAETAAILDAAEGKANAVPAALGSTKSGNGSGSSLPMVVSDSEDDSYRPSGTSSLGMVAKMFGHAGYDSHYLAFQTLLPLTDSSKMGVATARAVSQELLKPGNAVGEQVLKLVLSASNKDDDEVDMFKLKNMAMTVLANAVQAVKGKIDLELREELRPVLIDELHSAKENPRQAQMAAKCVEFLLQDDHDAAGFHDCLETAVEVGTARHAGLMRQAQRALDKLQQ